MSTEYSLSHPQTHKAMMTDRQDAYQALLDVVGPTFISDDPAICQAYSKDASLASVWRKHKEDKRTVPGMVALPADADEVRSVLRICNRHQIPVVPVNTGVNMCGLCVPNQGKSLALDLKRLDKIVRIDEKNLSATIQPHVSFARLQAETMKRGLWNGGTPLAPSNVGILSNMMFNGIWQSALAYGQGMRSLISLKVILPNGDVIHTGSRTLPQATDFWGSGPGPDLKGIFEFTHYGALGVVVEASIKLHRWVGGDWKGETSYDRPPLPDNHRIFFIEYPDFKSTENAMYEIAHAGIGTHLNTIPDVFNAYNTQSTQALTDQTYRSGMWPKNLIYVILAGISSARQLEYEEKVLRIIVEQTGGAFRDDLREVLSTWQADAFRSGDSVRMLRYGGYAIQRMSTTHIENYENIHKAHMEIIEKVPHCILDEETPEIYVYDRGYFSINETDNYYDQSDLDEVQNARKQSVEAFVSHTQQDQLGWYIHMEPLTSIFGPQVGPNFHLWLKRIKKVFDPNDIMNPDKLVKMDKEAETSERTHTKGSLT